MEGLAETYFQGESIFPDKRLVGRLNLTFELMAARPPGTLPRKLHKRGPLVGAYRMFRNPKVNHAAILKAHQQSCLQRMKDNPGKVLLLHDTTVLDYSGLDIKELGQVGEGHGRGLYQHNSLAVVPQTREVLGLMNQILHVRAKVAAKESRTARRNRPDRESRLWKMAVEGLPAMPPGVEVTDVSDRGSDVLEYIDNEMRTGRIFIVRSQHNRKLVGQEEDEGAAQVLKLHDRLRSLPAMGRYTVRASARDGGLREATVSLSWMAVTILPPRQPRGDHGSEPLALWAVIAREESAPAGEMSLEWILLTNRPVTNQAQAIEVVSDYACRWMVEMYHPYCLHCTNFYQEAGLGLGVRNSAA